MTKHIILYHYLRFNEIHFVVATFDYTFNNILSNLLVPSTTTKL